MRIPTLWLAVWGIATVSAGCGPGPNGEETANSISAANRADAPATTLADKLELARGDAQAALAELLKRYPRAENIETYSKARKRGTNGFDAMLNVGSRILADMKELESDTDAPKWATSAYRDEWQVPNAEDGLSEADSSFLVACAERDKHIEPLLRELLSYETIEPVVAGTDSPSVTLTRLDQTTALLHWLRNIAAIYCLLGRDDDAISRARLCVQVAGRFNDAGILASLIFPDFARRCAYDTVFNVASRIGPRFAPALPELIREYKPWAGARECWLGECAFAATTLDKFLRGGRKSYEAVMGDDALDGYEPDEFLAEGTATVRLLMKLHDTTDETDRIADKRVAEKVMSEAAAHGEGLREQSRKNLRFLALRPAHVELETDLLRVKLALLLIRLESASEKEFKAAAQKRLAQETNYDLEWDGDSAIIKVVEGHPVHSTLFPGGIEAHFRYKDVPLASARD